MPHDLTNHRTLHVWLAIALIAVGSIWASAQGQSRRAELEARLARERHRVLIGDRDAKQLQERIRTLYLELDRVLARDPKVQQLRLELEKLDREAEDGDRD